MTDAPDPVDQLVAELQAMCEGLTPDGVDESIATKIAQRIAVTGRDLSIPELRAICGLGVAPILALIDKKVGEMRRAETDSAKDSEP